MYEKKVYYQLESVVSFRNEVRCSVTMLPSRYVKSGDNKMRDDPKID